MILYKPDSTIKPKRIIYQEFHDVAKDLFMGRIIISENGGQYRFSTPLIKNAKIIKKETETRIIPIGDLLLLNKESNKWDKISVLLEFMFERKWRVVR